MGNTASSEVTSVKSLSDAELTRLAKADDECALIDDLLFDSNALASLDNIESYQISGAKKAPDAKGSAKASEIAAGFMQHSSARLPEKFQDLKASLLQELRTLRTDDTDDFSRELVRRRQAICRIHDGLVRQDEREARRVAAVKREEPEKANKAKKSLPVFARVGIQFGLGALLDLIEVTGGSNPKLYRLILKRASAVLADLPPMCLNSEDPTIIKAVEDVSSFLENLLNGKIEGITEEDQLCTLSPLLALALAKGNLTSALSVALKYFGMKPSESALASLQMITPTLSSLGQLKGTSLSNRISFNWNPNRLGPDIALSNNNLTITRTDSSGWGCNLSEQSITSGVHYIEFKVDRNSSSCLLLGVAGAQFSNFTSKSSGAHCYTIQSDGDTYMNDRSSGNVFRYSENDRLGMVVNMEDKTLQFFMNGRKQTQAPFGPLPDEVFLLSCFGGSNQFVTINNEAEIPEAAAELLTLITFSAKKEEVKVEGEGGKEGAAVTFPTKAVDILSSSDFAPVGSGQSGVTPSLISVYILACLDKLNFTYFEPFRLHEKPSSEPLRAKFFRQSGLSFNINPATFRYLLELCTSATALIQKGDFEGVSYKMAIWTVLCSLRMLRSHIFAALFLKLGEADTGLDAEMRSTLHNTIRTILSFKDVHFSGPELTKDDTDALSAMQSEASLTLLYGFEVFYPTVGEKLDYLITTLEDRSSRLQTHETHLNIQLLLLEKMSTPIALSPAFTVETEETVAKVQKFLRIIVDICKEQTFRKLDGGSSSEMALMLNLLKTAQKVLLSKATRNQAQGSWAELVSSYAEGLLDIGEQLLGKVREMCPGGVFTKDTETACKGTMIESLLTTLLLSLSVMKTDMEVIRKLMPMLLRTAQFLNNFTTEPPEVIKGNKVVKEVYESEHPYPNSARLSHTIQIPGAKRYTLTFNPQCRTEKNYDYLELWLDTEKKNKHSKWTGTEFPTDPVVVESPVLHFTFTSDDSTNYWGWQVTIKTEVDVNFVTSSWLDHLRTATNTLIVAFSQKLISGLFHQDPDEAAPAAALLKNKLLACGVKDKCHFSVTSAKPALSEDLMQLSKLSFRGEKPQTAEPTLRRAMSLDVLKKVPSSSVLGNYITNFSALSANFAQYSEVPAIDNFIKGSGDMESSWQELKKLSGAQGPLASVGGSELDKSERALFSVFAVYFGFAQHLRELLEVPEDADENLKFIVRQTCQIRKWAQQHKQKLMDNEEHKEVTYAQIENDLLEKCIILLNCESQKALKSLGIPQMEFVPAGPMLSKALSVDASALHRMGAGHRDTSLSSSGSALSKIKTLLTISGPSVSQEEGKEKKDFKVVSDLVYEFFNSPTTAEEVVKLCALRRNRAISRAIGLNFLVETLKNASPENIRQLQSLVSSAFSESLLNADRRKVHYLHSLEGIDVTLLQCLQRSFFTLYQLLLERLNLVNVKLLDCTSLDVSSTYLTIIEALSFPFEELDAVMLFDLNVRDAISFLLTWAKGQKITEKIKFKFDPSQCITELKVFNEREYTPGDGEESFSLNTKNRLNGDIEEVEEDSDAQKLCMQVLRGSKELLPVTDLVVGVALPEGYEEVQGNVNERGEHLQVYLKREAPQGGKRYLTKLSVAAANPIQFEAVYTPFADLQVEDQTPEDQGKRKKRKDRLRKASWYLFKLLFYTCCGKPEAKGSESEAIEAKKAKLQEMFTDVLHLELKWWASKEKLGPSEKPTAALRLFKTVSGDLWLGEEIHKAKLAANPMVEWIDSLTDLRLSDNPDIEPPAKQFIEVLYKSVRRYTKLIDCTAKGSVPLDESLKEKLGGKEEELAKFLNSAGEVDFFCFLHAEIERLRIETNPDLTLIPLFSDIPTDFASAKERGGLGNVKNVVNTLVARIHPNEDSTFLEYLRMFDAQSVPEKPGIIVGNSIPQAAPSEFLNSSKELDLYVSLNAIRSNPVKFQHYWRELKAVLSEMEGLPLTCSELYTPQKSLASLADYSASLLWTIYQCCGSVSFRETVASSGVFAELLKHAFVGMSEVVSTISCRIVRSIIAYRYSPDSIATLWSQVPKDMMARFISESGTKDLVSALFALAGLKCSVHLMPRHEFLPNYSKISQISHEALEFLRCLYQSSGWTSHIYNRMLSYIEQVTCAKPASIRNSYEESFGALVFLSTGTGVIEGSDRNVLEWSLVEMENSGVALAHVVKYKPQANTLVLFSEDDEEMHKESLMNLGKVLSTVKCNVFTKISEKDTMMLFDQMMKLVNIAESAQKLVAEGVEETHDIRAIWRQVGFLALQSATPLASHKLQVAPERLIDIMNSLFARVTGFEEKKTLSTIRCRTLRKFLYHKHKETLLNHLKAKEDVAIEIEEKKEEEVPSFKYMTEEEENKIIQGMSEDNQMLVVMLKSMGYSFQMIQKAMKEGLKDVEAISKWISEKREDDEKKASIIEKEATQSQPGKCIYKLQKSENSESVLVVCDNSGTAECWQSQCGHLVISAKAPCDEGKTLLLRPGVVFLRTLSDFTAETTVFATIGYRHSQVVPASFGFVIGNLRIKVVSDGEVCSILHHDSVICVAPAKRNFSFRLHIHFSGNATVTDEQDEGLYTIFEDQADAFDGVSLSDFGVFMDEGSSACIALKGLVAFPGKCANGVSYWGEDDAARGEVERKAEGSQLVDVKVTEMNLTALRLGLTGAPKSLVDSYASRFAKYDQALSELLSHEDSEFWPDKMHTDISAPIADIAFVDSEADIEEGYERIPLFNGENFTRDYSLSGMKIVTIKRFGERDNAIVYEIALGEDKADYAKLGDAVTQGSSRFSAQLSILKLSKLKSAGKIPIRSLAFVPCANPQECRVPPGYQLLMQNKQAVNFGFSSERSFLFLAYTKHALLQDCPILSLASLKKRVSEYGLVDSFDSPAKEDTTASDLKRLEEEIEEYSKYSLMELHCRTQRLEVEITNRLTKELLLKFIKVWPDLLETLVSAEKFTSLMRLVGSDFGVLESPLKSVLSSSRGAALGKRLLEECIAQFSIGSTLSANPATGSQREQVVQSNHPYENNMRFDQTVKVPGAIRLKVEFDPQCHTESGCDILRFFRSPNHADQICEYSGKNFGDLEIEGDTFYLYFYSDGSCVEWGYSFKVIPVFPPSSGKVDPQAKRYNIECALWILESIVLSAPLPQSLWGFVRRELLHPLNVFIHSTESDTYRTRSLKILKSLFSLVDSIPKGVSGIISLISDETKQLYSSERSQKSISSLMQCFLGLILLMKNKFQIPFVEKWFQEFSDAVVLMNGLFYRDERLQPILFEQFKAANKISFDVMRESQHPYSKKPATKQILISGASALELEFDEKCGLDATDAFYLSYDLAGSEPVEAVAGTSVADAGWASDPRGPDIQLSNGNKSVTRTNSSGWGCAIWNETYSAGKVKITFHIDNDGGSEYLYIGVYKVDASYSLNEVTNSENSKELWTWKTVGEFHRHGENVKNQEGRYRSNDDVSILLDLDEHQITFAKNGVDLHTFNNLAAEVIPCICFGGSNQHVSVASVEVIGASTSKLSKKKLTASGEVVYYHFPVNAGYLALRSRVWRNPSGRPKSILYSADGTRFRRLPGHEGKYTSLASPPIENARHYCEFQVVKLLSGKVQVGLGLVNHAPAAGLNDLVAYESTGLVIVNGIDVRAEPYAPEDRIGVYVDVERRQLRFYKNGAAVLTQQVVLEAGKHYCFAACLDSEGQELAICKRNPPPEELDLMGTRQEPAGNAAAWGYKFKVSPVFSGPNRMKQVASLSEKQVERWNAYCTHYRDTFTRQIDEQIVQYIDDVCISNSKDPMKLEASEINPKEELLQYAYLEGLKVGDIRESFQLLVRFNRQVEKILPLISLDLSSNSRESLDEIQRLFLNVRSFIFFSLKNKLFKEVLRSSNTDSRPEVPLDRTKAMRQKSNGRVDSQGMISVFGQLFRHIDKLNHKSIRNAERAFKVLLKGEGATDAGGPYNEVISTVCDELQSRFLPLLVPTQNNQHNVGDNRDSWVPNPNARSPLSLALFVFFGKTLGIAIRTQNNLNLSLPPLFWKRLVMEEVSPADLKSVDEITFQMLDILRHLEANQITKENFQDAFQNVFFTTQDSSGKVTELIPGGRERPLTYESAGEYADLVEEKRLSESGEIYCAIRKGISAVIPINLLNMFNWKQVEVMVCGAPDINVDVFMKNTEYDNIQKTEAYVGFFWEVLREFTSQQRSLFLRFVWGRSRLPASGEFRKFKLTRLNKHGNIDDYLPVSHTCFFQLDLPAYTTKDIMRDKLLYAITHCQAIDLDRIAEGGWEEDA